MNTKLSGAQLVLVPIRRMGVNYFPFVENINKRFIKFIDFFPTSYLPDVSDPGVTNSADMYLTIMQQFGNTELIKNMPLDRFNYQETLGVRQVIGSKINMQSCSVICENAAMVGKTAAFVFWYDLEEFSRRNTTDNTAVDSVSIPITNVIRYNQLPDSDRLTGKRFRRILACTPSITPDLQNGIAEAKLSNVYLTLRKGSYNVVENLPLPLLYQLRMLEKSEFQNIIFDFASSYLTVGGAGTITPTTDYIGKSVFLNLEYEL